MVFVKSINGDALLVCDCQNDFAAQGTPHALEGVPECLAKVGRMSRRFQVASRYPDHA